MGLNDTVTGACFCGAVSFEIDMPTAFCGHCHCSMCRRWSGGLFMAVGAEDIAWSGDAEPTVFVSSAWAGARAVAFAAGPGSLRA